MKKKKIINIDLIVDVEFTEDKTDYQKPFLIKMKLINNDVYRQRFEKESEANSFYEKIKSNIRVMLEIEDYNKI